MERSEILTTMAELKLDGMKAAYDEIIGTAVKRQHEPTPIVGDLLTAEISEKQARSIRYQITIAKLPLAKDVDDFTFNGAPACTGKPQDRRMRRSHAPLRQPLDRHSAARGSLLWITGTSLPKGVRLGADRGSQF